MLFVLVSNSRLVRFWREVLCNAQGVRECAFTLAIGRLRSNCREGIVCKPMQLRMAELVRVVWDWGLSQSGITFNITPRIFITAIESSNCRAVRVIDIDYSLWISTVCQLREVLLCICTV